MSEVRELNSLDNCIDDNNKSCDSLCEIISKQRDLVLDTYLRLKNEIKDKYQFSKEILYKMNPI